MANWSERRGVNDVTEEQLDSFYDRVQDRLADDEGQFVDEEPACGICGLEPGEHAYWCGERESR
jgi:hypothetical protein